MKVRYIHLLRGIAILMVVMIHCVQLKPWPPGDTAFELLSIILWDATGLFFMVAGFLFHHLSKRFEYGSYLWRKFTNVIVPFLLISTPGLIHTLGYWNVPIDHPELVTKPVWYHALFLLAYPGEQYNYPLWFIPVMATFFLMAPLFIWLMKRPRWFMAVLALACLYSTLNYRPSIEKYHHVNHVLYWLSSYMVGMAVSLSREPLMAWARRNEWALWAAWAAVVLVQFGVMGDGSPLRFEISNRQTGLVLNLFFAQKVLMFLALLSTLKRIENRPLVALDNLATFSFPIFFVHAYILKALFESSFGFSLSASVGSFMLTSVVVVAGSFALGWLSRKTLGPASRYVVGA